MKTFKTRPAGVTPRRTGWTPRPRVALAIKVAVVLVPLVASVAVSVLVAGLLERPTSLGGQVLWWTAILASSSVVLLAGEAIARRVLPLVSLLRLSLLFPGRAPSRVDIARRSSRSELERLADEVRTHGLGPDAEEAAITLVRLIAALDAHDRRTRGHSERVRTYTDLLAHRLHLDEEATNKLRWAALLHDIGKLSVPAEVLNKPGRLTPEEWELIHRHPAEGDRMLGALKGWLGPWALVVLEHHERWDGTGYPAGLAAEDISLGARLVAVADSYDVMTSVRSYQPQPRTPEEARDELVRCSGSQFDPGMVRCFLNISTRRLWWLLGPATWIVQVPVVGRAAAIGAHGPVAGAMPHVGHVVALTAVLFAAVLPGFGSGPGAIDAAAADPEVAAAPESRPTWGEVGGSLRASGEATPEAAPAVPTTTTIPPTSTTTSSSTTTTTSSATTTTSPVPSSRPTASTAGAPVPTAPPTAPSTPPSTVPATERQPGPGNGHAYGYGHDKGKGQGHDRHDADGDGVDDKAGGNLVEDLTELVTGTLGGLSPRP